MRLLRRDGSAPMGFGLVVRRLRPVRRPGLRRESAVSDRLREAQEELAAMRADNASADPTLFDEPDETDAAIESVADHAGPFFREKALEAVRRAAMANLT